MKRLFTLSTAIILTLGCFTGCENDNDSEKFSTVTEDANNVDDSNFTYWVNDLNDTIVEYHGNDSEIIIPELISGYEIKNMLRLTCENPENVRKVVLPKTLEELDEIHFTKLDNLEEISISEENEILTCNNGALYSKDMTVLYYCPAKVEDYVIPDTVNTIADFAFNECHFESITIPANVEEVGICVAPYIEIIYLDNSLENNQDIYDAFIREGTIVMCNGKTIEAQVESTTSSISSIGTQQLTTEKFVQNYNERAADVYNLGGSNDSHYKMTKSFSGENLYTFFDGSFVCTISESENKVSMVVSNYPTNVMNWDKSMSKAATQIILITMSPLVAIYDDLTFADITQIFQDALQYGGTDADGIYNFSYKDVTGMLSFSDSMGITVIINIK